ncbi:hypothetical protein [Candidatus Albibeggiatoa sp. nov. BB20]|uniref:carboxymuconolactone decarboxylase family protein n=1 Tax=Candidatus Albibeggiatoa sp. nov. BB20 TaxID=3162723 RepID=UPI0033656113
MTIVSTVTREQATGKVAEIYNEIEKSLGYIPQAFQTYSASPLLLELTWRKIAYFMEHPNLSMEFLAVIRMLVSVDNICDYCIGFNTSLLINMFNWSHEEIIATRRDPNDAPLSDKEKVLLSFVLEAASQPLKITGQDLQLVRDAGWEDTDIVDAVSHATDNVSADLFLNTFKPENDF